MMSEMSLALSEDDVYNIDLSDRNAHELVMSIIEQPGEMITYNWKENARKMLWWLKQNEKFAKG